MKYVEKYRWLMTASTISWVWGILLMLFSIALLIPAITGEIPNRSAAIIFSLIPLILGVSSAVSGFGIRRRQSPYHIFAIVTASANIIFFFISPVKASLLGIPLNGLILGIVIGNIKNFSKNVQPAQADRDRSAATAAELGVGLRGKMNGVEHRDQGPGE